MIAFAEASAILCDMASPTNACLNEWVGYGAIYVQGG
jgi:hypothetical protein